MPLFNQTSINSSYVKLRWGEPRVSTGLNQKNFGVWPDGCYEGFTIGPGGLGPRDIIVGPGSVSGNVSPSVSGVGYLDGNFDAALGYSIAVVNDPQGFSNTIQVPPGVNSIYHLNATGLEGKTVFIIAKAEYSINVQTTAELALVDGAYIDANPWVVVLGNVQVPSVSGTPLNGSMFQYSDPQYPRKTPMSSPTRAGLMPPSVWPILQQNMPWQNLLLMDVDPNNAFNFTITPSQFNANGKRLYTFVQQNVSSRFPRDATGNYNGGPNNTQLTVMNFITGSIGGAHQVPGNLVFPTPSVSGTPNSFQTGIVSVTPDDAINVVYGSFYTNVVDATKDQNIPVPDRTYLQIGAFVISTNGSGNILPLKNLLVPQPILWRRPFLNTGIGNGVQPNFSQEIPSGSIDGINKSFTLLNPPLNNASILVILDGIALQGSDWTRLNSTLTLNVAPGTGQFLFVYYIYGGQSMVSGYQEIPVGVVDGINDTFQTTGQVNNRSSLMVFVNGRIIDGSSWNLTQNLKTSTIKFTSDSIPAIGQSIYVFYFINVASQNFAGNNGVSNSGQLATFGTPSTPILVNPSIGVVASIDTRQAQWVASLGGQQTVTNNPQINSVPVFGTELILFGTSDTNYPTLSDGTGLALNGIMNLKKGSSIYLIFDGLVWSEVSRK